MTSGGLRAALAAALQPTVGTLLRDLDSLVSVRRSQQERLSNGTTQQKWREIANGANVGAFLKLSEDDGLAAPGEARPVVQVDGLLSAACTPEIGDGVRVLSGDLAGRAFIIRTRRPVSGIVWVITGTVVVDDFD